MDMATALAELLINKGPMFQACFTDPWVLACIAHVLGDFKLSSLNSRAALPGHLTRSVPRTTATGPAARTPTSPAAPTGSNSLRRSTSGRRPWPA